MGGEWWCGGAGYAVWLQWLEGRESLLGVGCLLLW